MQEESKILTSNLTTFENLLKLAPIITAGILAISITYDLAYLWALGLSITDIPSSISEHIRSAILWAPIFLMLSMALFLVNIFSEKSIKSKSIKVEPEKFAIRNNKLLIAVFFILVFLLLYLLIINVDKKFVFVILSLFWFIAIIGATIQNRANGVKDSLMTFIFFIIPVILFTFDFFGYNRGNELNNQEKPKWEYTLKKDDKEIIIIVNGQRRFTDFTIAILSGKKILIIPNSNIISMKSL